jgi:hypothetical protein
VQLRIIVEVAGITLPSGHIDRKRNTIAPYFTLFRFMKNPIFFLILLLTLSSCNLNYSSKNKDQTAFKHKNLLGFKISFLAELGDEKYEQLQRKIASGKMEIKYINDIIYISYNEELNACGDYAGNIEITGDTIKLGVHLTSDEVCTSKSIDRITFIIDNPDEKRKIIIK